MGSSRVLSEGDFHNNIPIGPWPKGMTPGIPLKSIPEDSLLDAVNVDIDDAGKVRTRQGFHKVSNGNDCRSLFSFGGNLYWLQGTNLVKKTPSGSSVVRGGYASDDRLSVAVGGGFTFVASDTFGVERMISGDVFRKAEPMNPVTLSLSQAAGSLDRGDYFVAVSYVDDYGIESAPTYRTYINAISGITVTFPASSDAGVVYARIYCTTANGSILYHHSDVAHNAGSMTITSGVGSGRTLAHENFYSMPSVEGLAFVRGRVVGYSGNTMFFAEPFMGSLLSQDGGLWVSFESDIVMMSAVEDGLYVGTDRMFFVSIGDDGMPSAREVAGYKPVKGTNVYDRDERAVYWWADDGLFMGKEGGVVEMVSSELLAPESFTRGASAIVKIDGISNVVSSFDSPGNDSNLRCYDVFEAYVERNTLI